MDDEQRVRWFDAADLTRDERNSADAVAHQDAQLRDHSISLERINCKRHIATAHPLRLAQMKNRRRVGDTVDLESRRIARNALHRRRRFCRRRGPMTCGNHYPCRHRTEHPSPPTHRVKSERTSLNVTSTMSASTASTPTRAKASRVRMLNSLPFTRSASTMRI